MDFKFTSKSFIKQIILVLIYSVDIFRHVTKEHENNKTIFIVGMYVGSKKNSYTQRVNSSTVF